MWKIITLHRDSQSNGQWKELQSTFETAFAAAGMPPKAAMYCNRQFDQNEVVFYFSPAGAELIRSILKRLSAEDGEAPAAEDVTLLVGHNDAQDTSAMT
ncbi:hypothetical protein ACQQ2Q_02185 [Agrobacterium sp. ES01]|uniref:hypothetical protein n=1 Tax=Agrobacterium sp. ES01 TaxID=3420714 RepID=UPI003D0F6C5B